MFRRALLQQTRQFTTVRPRLATVVTRPSFTPAPAIAPRQWVPRPARAYSAEAAAAAEQSAKEEAAAEAKPEAGEAKAVEEPASNGCEKEKAELEGARKDLETAKKASADFKDKFQRSVAEYHNLIERTERDKRTTRDFAIQKFSKDLLDSVDNLDRALEAVPAEARVPENKALMDLYGGLEMTRTILLGTLRKHGVEQMTVEGEVFDANKHEATFQAPMPGKEPGTVFHVQQSGWVLNGRTLRAAKVGVVAKPQ